MKEFCNASQLNRSNSFFTQAVSILILKAKAYFKYLSQQHHIMQDLGNQNLLIIYFFFK